MITFATLLLLIITIVLALAVGILMGYGAIAGLLWAFQHNRTAHPAPVLASASSSGD